MNRPEALRSWSGVRWDLFPIATDFKRMMFLTMGEEWLPQQSAKLTRGSGRSSAYASRASCFLYLWTGRRLAWIKFKRKVSISIYPNTVRSSVHHSDSWGPFRGTGGARAILCVKEKTQSQPPNGNESKVSGKLETRRDETQGGGGKPRTKAGR